MNGLFVKLEKPHFRPLLAQKLHLKQDFFPQKKLLKKSLIKKSVDFSKNLKSFN